MTLKAFYVVFLYTKELANHPPIYPVRHRASYISYDWEILHSFIKLNNIIPNLIYCDGEYGELEAEEGNWTGIMDKV